MTNSLIEQAFHVGDLSIDKLLAEWRWLLPERVLLVARSVFGDLFLQNVGGKVLWLQVDAGKLSEIAASESQFRDLLRLETNRERWLAETEAHSGAKQGLLPGTKQCIGFKIPTMFKECANVPDNAYVADLYEYVSFLGDMHRQIADTPDGAQVRLRIVP